MSGSYIQLDAGYCQGMGITIAALGCYFKLVVVVHRHQSPMSCFWSHELVLREEAFRSVPTQRSLGQHLMCMFTFPIWTFLTLPIAIKGNRNSLKYFESFLNNPDKDLKKGVLSVGVS